ncbi:hypothetical protein OG824_27180 [Streptomyces prunicolor]|uniref:hypothetical protein n=1 Tax=Streptomyces prunicolor TaxID=67348 RepID=UPI0022522E0A|nr:hypothetical protein [Streptomyces prunicolor]MCX5238891.1 hypothetical protein [Streptomyces prunicolor]
MTLRPHRHPTTSLAVAIAAVGCTVYAADTNWRFAGHYLSMTGAAERTVFVVAVALALVAGALTASPARGSSRLSQGLPQFLVWAIAGVQVVAAYAESGLVAGTVRAVIGPVLAAPMWHFVFYSDPCHCPLGADRHTRLPQVERSHAGRHHAGRRLIEPRDDTRMHR